MERETPIIDKGLHMIIFFVLVNQYNIDFLISLIPVLLIVSLPHKQYTQQWRSFKFLCQCKKNFPFCNWLAVGHNVTTWIFLFGYCMVMKMVRCP